MADKEARSFDPGEAQTDRGRQQGVGVGQAEMDQQRDAARPPEGDLGAGTPANVDIHNLGQGDNPQEDWGEPADEGATFSSTNTNRGGRTELERGQGAKTRQHNKDQFSRRA